MANIVMVAGGWHGGWALTAIARKLRARGHEVFTPTLTGLGERSHLAGIAINLDTHIEDVANVVRYERLRNVVLCGHSYAGMVITGVADRLPEQIASLVYVDAFVPKDGESWWALAGDRYPPASTRRLQGGRFQRRRAAAFRRATRSSSACNLSASCSFDRTLAGGSGESLHLCFRVARDAIHSHVSDAEDRSRLDRQVTTHHS